MLVFQLADKLGAELYGLKQVAGHGMTITYGEWAQSFLNNLGAPVTRNNLVLVVAWETAEGTLATWNPLATTIDMPSATVYNTSGVRNYTTKQQGIDATIKTLEVPTVELTGADIDRLVEWAGAALQAPHRAMSAQRGIPPVGVYVGYFAYGSPATRYGLYPGRRIVEVDGVPTPDLDALLGVVTGRPDRASVRLKTITWNNAPEVITLKLDKHYWPAYELRHTPSGWVRHALE